MTSTAPAALPRGIRNKNPCNIRHSPNFWWNGELSPDDDGFARFTDPVDGLRAAIINFHNYQDINQLFTVRGMISRQAPICENDTETYIHYVATRLMVQEETPIDFLICWREFLRAVVSFENGEDPYTPDQYFSAYQQSSSR